MNEGQSRQRLVLVAGPLPAEHLAILQRKFSSVHFERATQDGPVPDIATGAEVLLTVSQRGEGFAATLSALPNLRWVHTVGSGVDHLLPQMVSSRAVLTRTARARAVPMAEHVLAVTLTLFKELPAALAAQAARRWEARAPRTLAGAVVGIVGAGAAGTAAAKRFKAMGATTVGLKRNPSPVDEFTHLWGPGQLNRLLAASDVVVLSLPLTDRTRGMLGRDEFDQMKAGSYLVNIARGGIVVETDLVAALRDGRLAGAALDVFETEPLPPESPLWAMPNVIITPHSAAAAPEVWSQVIHEFSSNLERFLKGKPLQNIVDRAERGY